MQILRYIAALLRYSFPSLLRIFSMRNLLPSSRLLSFLSSLGSAWKVPGLLHLYDRNEFSFSLFLRVLSTCMHNTAYAHAQGGNAALDIFT